MSTSQKEDCTELVRLLPKLNVYIKNNLSKKRYMHSLRVANTAAKICVAEGLPPVMGHVAGLAHDIARELPDSLIIEYASKVGYVVDETYDRVVLLHGMAGRYILSDFLQVNNESVLAAVEHHTLGHPDLDVLGKIIFCADYIEPGRNYITKSAYRLFMSMSIDDMIFAVVDDCKRRGYMIHPVTERMLDSISLKMEDSFDKKE